MDCAPQENFEVQKTKHDCNQICASVVFCETIEYVIPKNQNFVTEKSFDFILS